jgi:hypothetical protein
MGEEEGYCLVDTYITIIKTNNVSFFIIDT